MTGPRSHFLPWDRPLLPQLVEWLAGDWSGEGPLDLGDTLLVVPTRQAGRRVREALAVHAASRSQAVFAPRVVTPDGLLADETSGGVASRLESLLAWVAVLRTADMVRHRAVFPRNPPENSFAWAFSLAQQLEGLQRTLAECSLRLQDVLARAGDRFPEAERWAQLGELGAAHSDMLASWQLREAQAARIAAAARPVLPSNVRRVVLAACPDPFPLALRALEGIAERVAVEVLIFALDEEKALFDRWGRPDPAAWARRPLDLEDFPNRVHLRPDPAEEAALAAAAAIGSRSRGGVALGVADPEVMAPLAAELRRAGLATFNPEGRPLRADGFHQMAEALSRLAAEDSFAAASALARCPEFIGFLEGRLGGGFSPARFLAEIDRLHQKHLPPTLAEARRHAPDDPGLAALSEIRAVLAEGGFPENANAVIRLIFEKRQIDPAREEDARLAESLKAWTLATDEISRATARSGRLPSADGWLAALSLYAAERRFEDRIPDSIDLQGWLELLWEDAPHLVVAGFNDGIVPEAVVGDAFIPESLRVTLGLQSNAERFARDAYVLSALGACRVRDGRLDLILAKASACGDPLRPSRLLLQCDDALLPDRIARLFQEPPRGRARPAWRRGWKLQPRRLPPPARVAATALNRWLQCPYRFYLDRVARLQPVDAAKTEMDALDFGTLCHAALESMGREPALRDSVDPAVIREYLLARLESDVARTFGRSLTLPLIVQAESARQRLGWAAEAQAKARAEGWVIERVEHGFELPAGPLTIVGRIDRIERHEATGAYRILDYKTSDRPEHPADAALRTLRPDDRAPAFARLSSGGRDLAWVNLQLPVYLRAFVPGGGAAVTAGYFNLPKAASETRICPWEDYTPELAESAWHCVEGIATAIAGGEFWPPAEDVRAEGDPYAGYFHEGAADSIAWEVAT